MDQIAETVLMGTLQVVLHIQCQNLHPTQNFGRYLLVVAEKSLKKKPLLTYVVLLLGSHVV